MDNVLEALKLAYEAEKNGLRMYLGLAKKTNVISGKNMFIQLASDEVDHLELIEKFIDKKMAGKPYENIEVPKGRLSKIVPNVDESSLQPVEKAYVSDEDALNTALSHEMKARDFYLEESRKAENEEVKKLFEDLAAVEDKHYMIIQAELDYIHKDGFWFDTAEFSLEKEG
ncbi:MAG: ferritin family protein [Deferribacterota bacterium]|nr:ferritin family protein [Deferribacterota bacterium]